LLVEMHDGPDSELWARCAQVLADAAYDVRQLTREPGAMHHVLGVPRLKRGAA
jgi:hypothetical protein